MKSSIVSLEKPPQQLKSLRKTPCLSLYMPTYRSHPDNLQDRILFRQLTRQPMDSLYLNHSTKEVKMLLLPFDTLLQDADFWDHTTQGIAVFGGKDFFEIVNLQIPPKAFALVADNYFTKPLGNRTI